MERVRYLDLPTGPGRPTVLDVFGDDVFRGGTRSVLDMPIKLPGDDAIVVLPPDLAQYQPIVDRVVENEQLYKDYSQHYIYLTVDARDVPPLKTQRRPGAHFDAYQPAPTPDDTITHTYIACSALPTEFFPEPVVVDQQLGCAELLASLDRQLEERAASRRCSVSELAHTYGRNTLLWLTPMHLHRAAVNTTGEPLSRVFVKVSVSKHIYNRAGNTANPHLRYRWDEVQRDHGTRNHPFDIA